MGFGIHTLVDGMFGSKPEDHTALFREVAQECAVLSENDLDKITLDSESVFYVARMGNKIIIMDDRDYSTRKISNEGGLYITAYLDKNDDTAVRYVELLEGGFEKDAFAIEMGVTFANLVKDEIKSYKVAKALEVLNSPGVANPLYTIPGFGYTQLL